MCAATTYRYQVRAEPADLSAQVWREARLELDLNLEALPEHLRSEAMADPVTWAAGRIVPAGPPSFLQHSLDVEAPEDCEA